MQSRQWDSTVFNEAGNWGNQIESKQPFLFYSAWRNQEHERGAKYNQGAAAKDGAIMRAAAEGDAVGGAAAETDAIEEQFLFRCGKNTKE